LPVFAFHCPYIPVNEIYILLLSAGASDSMHCCKEPACGLLLSILFSFRELVVDKKVLNHPFTVALYCLILTVGVYLLFSPWERCGFFFDDANFALGAQSFSLIDTRPHLPGYILHIMLIRLFRLFTGSAFSAMTLLSALYSGLAMEIFFLLLRKWADRKDALVIVLFTVTNPVVWFYGCSTEIYSFDLFFSITLVYLGLSARWIYILPVFAALGAGIRPSSAILLFPLYVYLWYAHYKGHAMSWKKCLLAHGVGLVAAIGWLYPLLRSAGGVRRFLALYKTHDPMDPLTVPQNLYRFISFNYTTGISLAVVLGMTVLFSKRGEKKHDAQAGNRKGQYLLVVKLLLFWMIPPLLLFLFYAYSKGYILLLSCGISCVAFILLRRYTCRRKLLIILAILQSVYFIFTPYISPDIDSYLGRRFRKKGVAAIWFDRIRAVYLMGQSRYRYLEKVDMLVSAIATAIKHNTDDPFYKKEYLLIDPTCPVLVRSLQVKHPHVHFAGLDVYDSTRFFSYNALSFANETGGIRRLLQSCLIFGRTDVITRFDLGPLIKRKDYGEFSLYYYTGEAFSQGAVPHETLFQRY